MTAANTTAKITTGDLNARAARILTLVADTGEKILANTPDPLDVPEYALLTLVQAGEALVRLAELDAQQTAQIEVLLDSEGDLWVRVGDDQFECRSSHEHIWSLEEIEDRHGVARVFVAAPRPAG